MSLTGRILENKDPGTVTFTEADWNQQSIDAVEKEGVEAWRMHWYRASKTLAERAAWSYMKEQKPSCVCLPPTILPFQADEQFRPGNDLPSFCPRPHHTSGRFLGEIEYMCVFQRPLSSIPAVATWYAFLTGEKTNEEAIAAAGILCDVRDVARTHIAALLLPEAGGQRFGVATRRSMLSDVADTRHLHTSNPT